MLDKVPGTDDRRNVSYAAKDAHILTDASTAADAYDCTLSV